MNYDFICRKYGFKSIEKANTEITLANKKVLVRVDFNISINDQGKILDSTRILASKKTIDYLVKKQAKVILISHLGQPEISKVPSEKGYKATIQLSGLSFANLITQMSELLGYNIKFIPYKKGLFNTNFLDQTNEQVIMLDNIRLFPGEMDNQLDLAQDLGSIADFYINDAFSVSHRAQASVCTLPKLLPSYAGFSLLNELYNLEEYCSDLTQTSKTLVIIGGKKISTKLPLIYSLLSKGVNLFVGGAMANTLFHTLGYSIGASYYEDINDNIQSLHSYLEQRKLILPLDLYGALATVDHSDSKDIQIYTSESIASDAQIFDVGPKTNELLRNLLKETDKVIWNGPIGRFEDPRFTQGTQILMEDIATATKNHRLISVIGGGDTLSSVKNLGYNVEQFTYASTAGGAFLAWLENPFLVGLMALQS